VRCIIEERGSEVSFGCCQNRDEEKEVEVSEDVAGHLLDVVLSLCLRTSYADCER